MLYTIENIPLLNFQRALDGDLSALAIDNVETEDCSIIFNKMYLEFIERIGGGKEWRSLQVRAANIDTRLMMLSFSEIMISKNKFHENKTSEIMRDHGMRITAGNETRSIEGIRAQLLLLQDQLTRDIEEYNDRHRKEIEGGKNGKLNIITQLPALSRAMGFHIPSTILLIEYIEYFKLATTKKNHGRNN